MCLLIYRLQRPPRLYRKALERRHIANITQLIQLSSTRLILSAASRSLQFYALIALCDFIFLVEEIGFYRVYINVQFLPSIRKVKIVRAMKEGDGERVEKS